MQDAERLWRGGANDSLAARLAGVAEGRPESRRVGAPRSARMRCDRFGEPALVVVPSPPDVAVDPAQIRSADLARVEATLFLAREPLTARRIATLAGLTDGSRARTLVQELRRLQEAADTAFRVEQVAGGYQILTRAAFGPWVRRVSQAVPRGRLSAAVLETLAIVAYRQPVTRAEVEAIRGVGSEEMLRQLMERDLVAIGGRAEDLGRPNVYVTTRRFLMVFGLSRLEDLPPLEAISSGPSVAEPPPASGGDATG